MPIINGNEKDVEMTCQWCTHYRRRDGKPMCLTEIDGGKVVLSDIKGLACEKFSPRKSCTTCEHRCSYEDREKLLLADGGCNRWALRNLSTWGGARRFYRK